MYVYICITCQKQIGFWAQLLMLEALNVSLESLFIGDNSNSHGKHVWVMSREQVQVKYTVEAAV